MKDCLLQIVHNKSNNSIAIMKIISELQYDCLRHCEQVVENNFSSSVTSFIYIDLDLCALVLGAICDGG